MKRGVLDKSRLPSPAQYYRQQRIQLRGSGIWRTALCPLHDDQNPSLSVNIETGGYKCFGCGESGGDVIDFHRAKHGYSFLEAIVDLDACEVSND